MHSILIIVCIILLSKTYIDAESLELHLPKDAYLTRSRSRDHSTDNDDGSRVSREVLVNSNHGAKVVVNSPLYVSRVTLDTEVRVQVSTSYHHNVLILFMGPTPKKSSSSAAKPTATFVCIHDANGTTMASCDFDRSGHCGTEVADTELEDISVHDATRRKSGQDIHTRLYYSVHKYPCPRVIMLGGHLIPGVRLSASAIRGRQSTFTGGETSSPAAAVLSPEMSVLFPDHVARRNYVIRVKRSPRSQGEPAEIKTQFSFFVKLGPWDKLVSSKVYGQHLTLNVRFVGCRKQRRWRLGRAARNGHKSSPHMRNGRMKGYFKRRGGRFTWEKDTRKCFLKKRIFSTSEEAENFKYQHRRFKNYCRICYNRGKRRWGHTKVRGTLSGVPHDLPKYCDHLMAIIKRRRKKKWRLVEIKVSYIGEKIQDNTPQYVNLTLSTRRRPRVTLRSGHTRVRVGQHIGHMFTYNRDKMVRLPLFAVPKTSNLLNTAVLSGRCQLVPMSVFTMTPKGQVLDITKHCTCVAVDPQLVKVMSNCKYLFFDSTTTKAAHAEAVIVSCRFIRIILTLKVYMPSLPVKVELSQNILKSIDHWYVSDELNLERKFVTSEKDPPNETPETSSQNCSLQYQQSNLAVFARFYLIESGVKRYLHSDQTEVNIGDVVLAKTDQPSVAQVVRRNGQLVVKAQSPGTTTVQILGRDNAIIGESESLRISDQVVTIQSLDVRLVAGVDVTAIREARQDSTQQSGGGGSDGDGGGDGGDDEGSGDNIGDGGSSGDGGNGVVGSGGGNDDGVTTTANVSPSLEAVTPPLSPVEDENKAEALHRSTSLYTITAMQTSQLKYRGHRASLAIVLTYSDNTTVDLDLVDVDKYRLHVESLNRDVVTVHQSRKGIWTAVAESPGSDEYLKILLSPSTDVYSGCYQGNMAVSYAYINVRFNHAPLMWKSTKRNKKPAKEQELGEWGEKSQRGDEISAAMSYEESQNQMFRHRMNSSDKLTESLDIDSKSLKDVKPMAQPYKYDKKNLLSRSSSNSQWSALHIGLYATVGVFTVTLMLLAVHRGGVAYRRYRYNLDNGCIDDDDDDTLFEYEADGSVSRSNQRSNGTMSSVKDWVWIGGDTLRRNDIKQQPSDVLMAEEDFKSHRSSIHKEQGTLDTRKSSSSTRSSIYKGSECSVRLTNNPFNETLETFSSDEDDAVWNEDALPWKCHNTLDRRAMYKYIDELKETNA